MSQTEKTILAIDPGYDRCGVAVFSITGQLLWSDCLETNKKNSLPERLFVLGQKIEKIIKERKPKILYTEKIFFSVNQKTAIAVAETRGMISYLAAKNKILLKEFTPQEIKLTVTGSGRADKNQVAIMVKKLLPLTKKIARDDEYDAIAIGLTALAVDRGLIGK